MEETLCMSNKELTRAEVLQRVTNKSLKLKEAAELLHLSKRQAIRLLKRYRQIGAKGLLSQKRGKPSNHQIPKETKEQAVSLIHQYYPDFRPTLAQEKLSQRDHLFLSLGTVRKLMITYELWHPKRKKRLKLHQTRTRRQMLGEVVQIDGSDHDWFEGRRSRCTLLVAIDDATGQCMHLQFAESESTWSYFDFVSQYIKKEGRPMAFYSDRFSVFRVNREEAVSGKGETQFSRAMKQLDIQLIFANSPQAKGRVERANRTLQDRLIKELRLRGIDNIEEANKYLPDFIQEYNNLFAVKPISSSNAHRPCTLNLERIFCLQAERTLSKNLQFQYKNVIYRVVSERPEYSLRKQKITILERANGEITIEYKGKPMQFEVAIMREPIGPIASEKELNTTFELRKTVDQKLHPWRQQARASWRRRCYTNYAN
jgi:hypothetical protein